jgi:hypothetical protein
LENQKDSVTFDFNVQEKASAVQRIYITTTIICTTIYPRPALQAFSSARRCFARKSVYQSRACPSSRKKKENGLDKIIF